MASWDRVFHHLLSRRELDAELIRWVMEELIEGRAGEAEAAAFLMGLRLKGETAGEITAAAIVLRRHMLRWDPGPAEVLDTCGTGGDGSGTFNISTATALVAAGAGVRVVKHGNRSVSSRSGSADVLTVLGVPVEGDAVFARRCLDETGFAFCFAPLFHPALKHVAAVRRKLGIPTIFNSLGPLVNPAGASRQLLGVGRHDQLELMAAALAQLSSRQAVVVHSADGLDEVSLRGATHVRLVTAGVVHEQVWSPADFDLEPVSADEVRADGPRESAAIIEQVLQGHDGPALRLVLANTAAALLAAGKTSELPDGVRQARQVIGSGAAWAVLQKLRTMASTHV